jgi:hypothetical protein
MKRQQVRFSLFVAAGVTLLSAVVVDARVPPGRFVVGTDPGSPDVGIVLDRKTGLTWERSPGPLSTKADAADYCYQIRFDTGTVGWRLPTVKELMSLVDYAGDYGPNALIDQTIFPGTPTYGFWSSTSSPARPNQCIDFTNGSLGCYVGTNYVRCVH